MSRFTVNPDYYSIEPTSEDPILPGGLVRTKKLNVFYIDINCDYRVNGKGLIVYDEDAVKRQIANIMATPLGSEQFEPTFGSNVPYRLMDPITNSTSFLLFNDTIGALSKWMGNRISVNRTVSFVRPIDNDVDNEGYEVSMYYSILETKAIAQYNAFLLR